MIAKFYFSRHPLYNINKSMQSRLRYIVTHNGTKLERTSLSTGGSIVPTYDIVYIAQLDFENKEFLNYLFESIRRLRNTANNILYCVKYTIHKWVL